MYVGSYVICALNWNWWLTQNHFLIKHWSQHTHRCSARVVGLEYSLVLVSPYNTVRSGTLTWHEWGLWLWAGNTHNMVCQCAELLLFSPRRLHINCQVVPEHMGPDFIRTVAAHVLLPNHTKPSYHNKNVGHALTACAKFRFDQFGGI